MSHPAGASILSTFLASVRSVGTAVTMTAVGMYLHRLGYLDGPGKKTLAILSQQVTFPLFLFTKIMDCNQDWSTDPCPDITNSLADVWILLWWPIFVVGVGAYVGKLVARVTRTPKAWTRTVVAAVAFGNSTGLPITLLTVVHANFPSTSNLGRIDPTLFLSVYLVLYPVLQWGLGGWLLAPEDETNPSPSAALLKPTSSQAPVTKKLGGDDDDDDDNHRRVEDQDQDEEQRLLNEENQPLDTVHPAEGTVPSSPLARPRWSLGSPPRSASSGDYHLTDSLRHNVLNNKQMDQAYLHHRHGLSSSDEGLYISDLDLPKLWKQHQQQLQEQWAAAGGSGVLPETTHPHIQYPQSSSLPTTPFNSISGPLPPEMVQQIVLQQQLQHSGLAHGGAPLGVSSSERSKPEFLPLVRTTSEVSTASVYDASSIWATLQNIMSRCFQPPVIGALAGITCSVISPLRGLFVDLDDREGDAPLEWMFDGLHAIGLAAVPINMIILGSNLSASLAEAQPSNKKNDDATTVGADELPGGPSLQTLVGVVIGKMIVMPFLGITTAAILKQYIWHIPEDISAAFYLVLMIVCLTPTANNVMVMVELSGSGAQKVMAQLIALQYAVAPLVLSITMTIAIGVASDWSR